jgi:hypothetical protein
MTINKILFPKAQVLQGGLLLVPFVCGDADGYHLHDPVYNRTVEENQLVYTIIQRLQDALDNAGYELVNFSFSSYAVIVKRK